MKAAWFLYAVVGLQAGAAGVFLAKGQFKLATYWLLVGIINAIAATF